MTIQALRRRVEKLERAAGARTSVSEADARARELWAGVFTSAELEGAPFDARALGVRAPGGRRWAKLSLLDLITDAAKAAAQQKE